MCGGGLTWTYKPTPQPGDFVQAKICVYCGKRAKRPNQLRTVRTVSVPGVRVRTNDEGEIAWRPGYDVRSDVFKVKDVHSCCSRDHRVVYGRVERTTWSYYHNGSPRRFFLVVFVPILGRRHWATLETVELVDANEYLINNVPL